jgi:hypothetical protein
MLPAAGMAQRLVVRGSFSWSSISTGQWMVQGLDEGIHGLMEADGGPGKELLLVGPILLVVGELVCAGLIFQAQAGSSSTSRMLCAQ